MKILAPTLEEWLWIYGPLAFVLLLAIGMELRTKRIPGPISAVSLVYFLATRMVIGPEAPWQYWLSLAIVAVFVFSFAWPRGYVGGGAAKLAIATAAALVPWMALALCAAPTLIAIILMAGEKIWRPKRQTVPGSILLTGLIATVVGIAALVGS